MFAAFEMVAAWALGDGFWMPLRMIGAIALGEEALEASYSLAGAATVGALVHMALSGSTGPSSARCSRSCLSCVRARG